MIRACSRLIVGSAILAARAFLIRGSPRNPLFLVSRISSAFSCLLLLLLLLLTTSSLRLLLPIATSSLEEYAVVACDDNSIVVVEECSGAGAGGDHSSPSMGVLSLVTTIPINDSCLVLSSF